jgi:hypothetical protein
MISLSPAIKPASEPQLFAASSERVIGNVNEIVGMYQRGIFSLPNGRTQGPLGELLEWLCHYPSLILTSPENTFLRHVIFASREDLPLPHGEVLFGRRETVEAALVRKMGHDPRQRSIRSYRRSRERLDRMTVEQRTDYMSSLTEQQVGNMGLRAILSMDQMEADALAGGEKRRGQRDQRVLTKYRMKS